MLELGSQIGDYRIERLVGRGGMGEVYEATQLALGRTVALKVLHTSLLEDDEFRERFRREGKLQAQLEHPNVVTVYEAGEISEGLFLAMRFIRGATLKDVIVAERAERRAGDAACWARLRTPLTRRTSSRSCTATSSRRTSLWAATTSPFSRTSG